MKTPIFKFKSKVWLYAGPTTWHFVTVPREQSEQIKFHGAEKMAGWGSIRMHVTIGKTEWDTSVFPEKRTGCYILPLKAAVRKAENISDDDTITVSLKIA